MVEVNNSNLEGLKINDFTLTQKLGSGGFSDVFLGIDKHNREYCIKILTTMDFEELRYELMI